MPPHLVKALYLSALSLTNGRRHSLTDKGAQRLGKQALGRNAIVDFSLVGARTLLEQVQLAIRDFEASPSGLRRR